MTRATVVVILLVTAIGARASMDGLVPLAQPGPWSGVSALIGYGERLWFVNSVKFADHNSADVYSYDPRRGTVRYEAHLFSQDAGEPTVAHGLLYWPFEDPRFSTGRGEYLVTDGQRWRWRILPDGEVFHVHAMTSYRGTLYAATSAWRAGLQRSDDGGTTWRVVYQHPGAPRTVSRITALATSANVLYAGLTASDESGVKLLRWDGDTLRPVAGWPKGVMVDVLAAFRDRLYGVNTDANGRALWRTDGRGAERVSAFGAAGLRALAAGPDALWAVAATDGGGALWRSSDGVAWTIAQRFDGAEPLALTVYAGNVYVGTRGPNGRGTLWGPRPPSTFEAVGVGAQLPSSRESGRDSRIALAALDRALAAPQSYAAHGGRLHEVLQPLALSGERAVGVELSRRLDRPSPALDVPLFGGAVVVPAATLARWYLLWAIALNGHGHVPVELLTTPWSAKPNRAEKYLEPVPAAAWAVARIGQSDDATIGALVARLGTSAHPTWVDGDLVGALTVLTGERFGYDRAAWRRWWGPRRSSARPDMIEVPAGTLRMGADDGETPERPAHRLDLSSFWIDRFETTNAEFGAFIAATRYRTDVEGGGIGWHWDGAWREVRGADWRHPHGPASTIDGLERHPVVQVSWNDARAYCAWRGKRLPTEAEWERAARGAGDRRYPWGDGPPRAGRRHRASYGSDRCCRADAGDGYLFTAPVGSFPLGRSPFGVEDLAGNVWEWVEDWFDETFYARSPTSNPVNRDATDRKVIRGGGWGNDAWGLRSTLRHANPPDIGLSMVGIRCAR